MKGRITTAITKNNSNSNSNSNNNSSNKGLPVNEQIYAKEVRLISETGEVLGVMPTSEALRQARENGFDLVMVTNASSPPVCKLLDYGRHRYELDKRLKDARKKTAFSRIKRNHPEL